MLDLKHVPTVSRSRLRRLSNLTRRSFRFDLVPCESIEGLLIALTCSDPYAQRHLCMLSGADARRAASQAPDWNAIATFWWMSEPIKEGTQRHHILVNDVYDHAFEQDQTFVKDLCAIGGMSPRDVVRDMKLNETVLPVALFAKQLRRLQERVCA